MAIRAAQNQFRTLTWGIGVLFVVAGTIFIFLFGKSFDSAKDQIIQEVDSKVIEYRIVQTYKSRLEDQVQLIIDSGFTQSKIENNVKNSVSEFVEKNIGEIIEEKVSAQLGDIEKESFQKILQRITARSEAALDDINVAQLKLNYSTQETQNELRGAFRMMSDLSNTVEKYKFQVTETEYRLRELEDDLLAAISKIEGQ